jgi:hydrogenase nickel incorporation protein HypA/HybF
MHELGITENIVAIACERANNQPIEKLTLVIGQLTAIMPDAIKFCFDVCSENTLLAGAELEILEIAGLAKCQKCQTEFSINEPYGICPQCDSINLDIIAGEELQIQSIEVKTLCA